MINNQNELPITFDIATLEDNLRYINRVSVSDMQAAFLVCGYIPFENFILSTNSTKQQQEVYETYSYLKNAAEEGKIHKALLHKCPDRHSRKVYTL